MLKIKKLNQFYGESHTLWDVDLDVLPGTCTCLMGRNGVGKTTLLKSIMGLLPVSSGSIFFEGNDFTGKPAELRARKGIGYVPQGREIFTQLSVEENLRVALLARDDGLQEIPELISSILFLSDFLDNNTFDFSATDMKLDLIQSHSIVKIS